MQALQRPWGLSTLDGATGCHGLKRSLMVMFFCSPSSTKVYRNF